MSNNKAREVNNPIIKQLMDETSPEELAKIDTEMTNNKQQTAVKLYTEEQVLQIIGNLNREYFVTPQELLEEMKLTSTELPSDEEIEEESPYVPNDASIDFWSHKEGFVDGAKWMRDKIHGGEQ
jgi:hypothetical protein